MADYMFKVQVILPGNVETVILRQYIDPVDRCFDKFKKNLIQRYEVLNNLPFKMMWIDHEGDKISIFNEEDLRTFMEMKGTKLFVEVDDNSNPTEKKTDTVTVHPVTRVPLLRSACGGRGSYSDRRCRYLNGLSTEVKGSNPYGASNATPTANSPPLLHIGVVCDGCDSEIRGYRYKCIECPDFDLCFNCEMKTLHGDHMMIRIAKPLDRPFNRHFLKAMMKQRSLFRESGEEKEKEGRRRHGHHSKHFGGNTFFDVMTDIAKNMSTTTTAEPSNEKSNDATPGNENKSAENDAKQFALNSDTFAKAGVVLSNLAQHFASVMDPFAIHEFIPTTSDEPKTTEHAEAKSNESQKSAEKKRNESAPVVPEPQPAQPTAPVVPEPQPAQQIAPVVPIAPIAPTVPTPSNDLVTIEDIIEIPADDVVVRRDSSPIPDWALVDVNGHVEGEHTKHTGAIPKAATPPLVHTPGSVGSGDVAQALPNYAVLARDLQNHLQNTLKSQASQTPPQIPIPERVIHHPNPRINEAIITMTSMGFSNGGGWLTRLLENVNGDIPKALEKLHPSQ